MLLSESRSFRALALACACALAATSCNDRTTQAPPEPRPVPPVLDESFLAASAATQGFKLGRPVPLAVTKDGAVLFRRTPARNRSANLYELDPKTGATRVLAQVSSLLAGKTENLSDAEKARRERTRTATSGVVDIDVSEDDGTVLVPLGERVFLVDRPSGGVTELEVGEGFPFDPRLSRDGRRVAFVRGGDLWVVTRTEAARKVTAHPPGDVEYATAEFVAQEELDRRRGYWWSPDGSSIAFQRTDTSKVETLFVSDPRHPERPPVPFKYPRAGKTNARVDLGIVSADGGAPRWVTWDLDRWPYLARVVWPKIGPLHVVVLSRDQTEIALLTVDPSSGATTPVHTEKDAAWINLTQGSPWWLEDGSGFLWTTEREGAFTLELRDARGALTKRLTDPSFGLRDLGCVDRQGRFAVVEASKDPRESHVFRVPLDGGAPVQLTEGGGVHRAFCDHDGVVVTSQLRGGGVRVAVLRDGAPARELPSVSERPSLEPTTVLESVEAGGRTFHTAVTRPRRFDPKRRYPVLLKVYAGPGSKTVLDARDGYLMDQWYADAGFVVVRADGRGTPDRGREWERVILRDVLTIPLEDQVAALGAMGKRHPEMDMDKVGVFGWSFGGYVATLAALLRPDVFKAAVAGAPVTDWTLYDTAYTERYMRTPQDNADGYTRTSALTHAAKLERPLLLIHGITDDNVHFAHALALVESLYVAGKRAEVVTLSATHMVPDPKLAFAREKVQVDFLRKHLAP